MTIRPLVSAALPLVALLGCGPVEPIEGCDPIGAATPMCGFQNPEDLALLPDGRHVLVSEYGDFGAHPGRLSLFDLETRERRVLFSGAQEGAAPGPWGAPDCPGPPSPAFSPHGLHLSRRADGPLELLVVQHGARESVEMFEVVQARRQWELEWRGCAIAPEDAWLNDVVALPEGGFLATHMMPRAEGLGRAWNYAKAALFGSATGHVLEWQPDAGFSEVPGTRGALCNGIELSADGEKIFLNQTLGNAVTRIDRRTGRVEATATVASPDNSTWSGDGRLLVASLRGSTREILACGSLERGSCPAPFAIVALEPDSMLAEVVYTGGPGTPSGAGTVGLEVDGGLLIGTFAGDRLVLVSDPSAER